MLDTVDAPLVIGDIPDTSAAIGHMLARSMVPDEATRTVANRRLEAWAAERPQVSIIRLGDFVKRSESNASIKAGPLTLESGTTRALLQADHLHPTPRGCAALSLAVMATLTDDGLKPEQVLWDPDKIVAAATGE